MCFTTNIIYACQSKGKKSNSVLCHFFVTFVCPVPLKLKLHTSGSRFILEQLLHPTDRYSKVKYIQVLMDLNSVLTPLFRAKHTVHINVKIWQLSYIRFHSLNNIIKGILKGQLSLDFVASISLDVS